MNEQIFVDRREPDWVRLTRLCDRADSSPANLEPEELRELVRLYRRISTDLALARTKSTNVQLIDFLNDLAGRAYGILYRAPRKPFFQTLFDTIVLSAQTVRRCKVFVFISAFLFFGSAIGVNLTMHALPQTHDFFVPESHKAVFEGWKNGEFEERSGGESLMMTGFYASNNPRTSIIAGSVGAGTFGFLSLLMIAQNGGLLGALAFEVAPVGKLGFMLSSIAPHGVPELSGIIISGAAGMLLGWALINPGRRSRGAALRAVGKDAIVLLGTSVVLMFIAAPIEGFFSFNPRIPQPLKVMVAVVTFVMWMIFWSQMGKTRPEPTKR